MMLDKIEIVVRAGNGGNGVVSFRREKFVPFGGPDGGDGGGGGDVVVVAEHSVTSLARFERNRLYRAEGGKNGQGQKKHGRSGEDLVLAVPLGTVVLEKTSAGSDLLVADLEQPGQRAVVARGGKGGMGNSRFASSLNQAPRLAQKGEVGEEESIVLEMRLIADVGIIGYPNVGKSTLLSTASAAKPKVASYPFTTREPILGVVEVGQRSFVMAEIPGLIDGAHLGRGLGHDFLRHIVRTKMLIPLLDGSSPSPAEDMTRVNMELGLFDSTLAKKPQLVAVNKIDLPQVHTKLAEIKADLNSLGVKAFFISAETKGGVPKLMAEAMKLLGQATAEIGTGKEVPLKVFRPQPRGVGARVHKEGDIFVVVAPELERIIAGTDITNPGVPGQLRKRLERLGVSKTLVKSGIKPGDKVRCGELEWEW